MSQFGWKNSSNRGDRAGCRRTRCPAPDAAGPAGDPEEVRGVDDLVLVVGPLLVALVAEPAPLHRAGHQAGGRVGRGEAGGGERDRPRHGLEAVLMKVDASRPLIARPSTGRAPARSACCSRRTVCGSGRLLVPRTLGVDVPTSLGWAAPRRRSRFAVMTTPTQTTSVERINPTTWSESFGFDRPSRGPLRAGCSPCPARARSTRPAPCCTRATPRRRSLSPWRTWRPCSPPAA